MFRALGALQGRLWSLGSRQGFPCRLLYDIYLRGLYLKDHGT